ncbi:MAG TPA: hypothetical protein PKN47_02765 [Nitrospira sp.]|nr:hypothetical protein [Candidatus Nomurabacteria bacterium]HNP80359.1 hypothetical protein [Nitrospira sp.]
MTYRSTMVEKKMQKPMLCPVPLCGQPMSTDPRNGYDALTGLEGMACLRCGHRGLKAGKGLQLLFAGQHEYVFSYGPSLSCLKVVLSSAALNLFRTQGVTPVRLATHMAEWALLKGQVCGTVRPSGDLVQSGCYQFCRHQATDNSAVSSW